MLADASRNYGINYNLYGALQVYAVHHSADGRLENYILQIEIQWQIGNSLSTS